MTRSISGTHGTLSQVYAEVRPRPEAIAIERMTASAVRTLRTTPSTRREMNGSTRAIVCWLAPGHPTGIVAGEAVVHLEACPRQASAVHRAVDELAVERTEQRQILDHVSGAEEPVNARAREYLDAAGQQLGPVCYRQRISTRRERAASRVVGRDDH